MLTSAELQALGLPAAQADKSVATDAADLPTAVGGGLNPQAGGRLPTACYWKLAVKEGADRAALKAALAAYRAASAAAKGSVHCAYSLTDDGEVLGVEVYDGPVAMDNHIGHCFPSYAQMMGAGAAMAEIVCVTDASEVEFWKGSLAAWGAPRVVVSAHDSVGAGAAAATLGAMASSQELQALGLPAAQADKSVATDAADLPTAVGGGLNAQAGGRLPATVYWRMEVKEGADRAALKAALAAYRAASAAAKGSVHCAHALTDGGEVVGIEVFNGPAAMDNHIGHCFPSWAQMMPHVASAEIVCVPDASEVEFWKGSLAAWGAPRVVVSAAEC